MIVRRRGAALAVFVARSIEPCPALRWSGLASACSPHSTNVGEPRRLQRQLHTTLRLQSAVEHKLDTSKPSSPIARYDELTERGLLRDDSHQRKVVQRLEDLHNQLKSYKQNVHPEPQVVKQAAASIFSRLFAGASGSGNNGAKKDSESDSEKLKIPDDVPKGLYLYGDVGTGKSMLMDLFYDTLPSNIERKRRVHFHQFMIDAHKRMHAFKSLTHRPSGMVMSAASAAVAAAAGASRKDNAAEEVDPIPHVARTFALEASVLCFDEFQVTDIADAMILRRLFEHMLWHGVVCVATSNRHPDELYKNGIQRTSFVPCIELLKRQLGVINLDSGTDYRKLPRTLTKVFFSPASPEIQAELDKLWAAMTSDPDDPPTTQRSIEIWGRKLHIPQSTKRCARFTFQELCGKARSAADYIEVCRSFSTIFIDGIPKMNLHSRDLARRFITFIDAAYESKTRLFATSEVDILQIFSGDVNGADGGSGGQPRQTKDQMRALMDDLGLTMEQLGGMPMATGEEEVFAFARVLSRLNEMSSKQYAELSAGSEAPPEF